MARTPPATYREAGVDTDAKTHILTEAASTIQSTFVAEASGWGGFAGVLRLPAGIGSLAVTIDGAGTKATLARTLGRDRVIGWDIVAHCANDLAAAGARPLCFADYIAMGWLVPEAVHEILGGMADGCRALGIPLLTGETAEMPGVYRDGACDVVGVMIGSVAHAPGPGAVQLGDCLIAFASDGLHTNGYSLARRLIEGEDLHRIQPDLDASLADALMAPHALYAPALLALMETLPVHAAAHITGGGLPDNLARVFPPGLRAEVQIGWPVPPIFRLLQRIGRVDAAEMYHTFNMGVGMVAIVAPADTRRAIQILESRGIRAFEIGRVVDGDQDVVFLSADAAARA